VRWRKEALEILNRKFFSKGLGGFVRAVKITKLSASLSFKKDYLVNDGRIAVFKKNSKSFEERVTRELIFFSPVNKDFFTMLVDGECGSLKIERLRNRRDFCSEEV
jgi:hypothetical protein